MNVGVIQVRMGSERLPGKALKEINGVPLLQYLVERAKAAKVLDQVVIATGSGDRNRPIVEFAAARGIGCYVGSEQDLVQRLCETAEKFDATTLVRITGDCPFVDPGVIDEITRFYLKHRDQYDYVSNAIKATYPDGLDLDILPRTTMERLRRDVQDPFWREWSTSYLREHPGEYRAHNFENSTDLSALRWTVDYPEDFEFASEVFTRLYPKKKVFLMQDMLDLLRMEPSLGEINQKYARDAAYYAAKKEQGK